MTADVTKSYHNLIVKPISRGDAKALVIRHHYMKTFPNGSKLYIGIFDKSNNRVVGVAVFGYAASTVSKVEKLVKGVSKSHFIEMQRLWISDLYGHNSESFVLAQIIKLLKENTGMKVIFTHAGGCKNDCGIVYQASGWLYFGKQDCKDFYLTKSGEYKNIASAMRFGRVDAKGKTPQKIGEELFGEGEIVDSARYSYLYPIDKGIRRRLTKSSKPFPKDSAVFRKDQQWMKKQGGSEGSRLSCKA